MLNATIFDFHQQESLTLRNLVEHPGYNRTSAKTTFYPQFQRLAQILLHIGSWLFFISEAENVRSQNQQIS